MKTVLLVRMGEIFLKGDNRNFFIKALVQQTAQGPGGHRTATLELTQGRIYIRNIADMEDTIHRVTRVFGVHSVSPVVECEKNIDVICGKSAVELMQPFSGTFKVQLRAARTSASRWIRCRLTRRSAISVLERPSRQSFRGCA